MIEYIVPLGILFIFLGIIIVFVGSVLQQGSQKTTDNKSNIHVGVGGFIGPIPFGFANSKTALYITLGAAAFFMIIWLVLRYAV
ncbi:DUF131 domain-containing protein [Candidatus Woesearchaeota archaeon]|nr:DUF131 domain-containing protein [Candidatus Woesearchaeota archaeon]